MKTWQLQDARREFSSVFEAAQREGPQRVTRRGKSAVVIVSEQEWERLNANIPSFGELLANCPIDEDVLSEREVGRRTPWDD